MRAAREAVGPGIELMLDVNCPWTPDEAIRMGRALAECNLAWLKEPVWPPEDYHALARVAATPGIPWVEYPGGELETPLLQTPIRAVDGVVEVPTGSGLGVALNEDAVRRHHHATPPDVPFTIHRDA